MKRIKGVEPIVKTLLKNDPSTRDDDKYLYFKVSEKIAASNGENIYLWGTKQFFESKMFPTFESVSRCRRRLQSEFPELKASKYVADARAELETEYRNYAMGV